MTLTQFAVPAVYRSSGYGEWEDGIQAEYASNWKTKPEQVRAMLAEMFEEHEDVHDLICYFLRRVGRRRPKKDALNKVLLEEFLKWKQKKAKNLPK
jgi:hypothetical protein